jgi:hypothetical protein
MWGWPWERQWGLFCTLVLGTQGTRLPLARGPKGLLVPGYCGIPPHFVLYTEAGLQLPEHTTQSASICTGVAASDPATEIASCRSLAFSPGRDSTVARCACCTICYLQTEYTKRQRWG